MTSSSGRCYPIGLDVADSPTSWKSAGFTIDGGNLVRLGEVTIRLLSADNSSASKGGIVGWAFHGLPAGTSSIHGIPIVPPPAVAAGATAPVHANG